MQAGIFALWNNSRNRTYLAFAVLSFLFAIYAFSYALFFSADSIERVYLYDRIASVGWVFFPLATVVFFLLITNTFTRILKIALYGFFVPVALFSFTIVQLDLESLKTFYQFEENWYYTPNETALAYVLFVFYLIASVLVAYFVLINWLYMAPSNREKHKAKILIITLSLFFLVTFLTNLIFPFLASHLIPAMAPINALFLIAGISYVLFFWPQASISPDMVYHSIINHVKEFLFFTDSNGKVYAANQYTQDNLKYNAYEIARNDISVMFSDADKLRENLAGMESRSVSRQMRMDLLGRDGSRIPVMMYIIKISDHFQRLQGYVFSCIDYRYRLKLKEEVDERLRTEKNLSKIRKELELLVKKRTQELQEANMRLQQEIMERNSAEEQIKSDLQEKLVLVQEVHHRVKNNIQVIISLVNMLSNHPVIEDKAAEKLRDIAEKVRYISRIHEDFYTSPNLSRIAFSAYLKKSVGDIYSNYGRYKDIVFKLNLSDDMLDINQAIPLGIIFNELMINAMSYAFNEEKTSAEKNTIRVEFYNREGQYSLLVSDNGNGLPGIFHEIRSKKIGLQLVDLLVKEHLKGSIAHYNHHGTTFIVKFSQN